MIRVLVVDDQELVRSGLTMLLSAQDGFEVVGEAADGLAAVSAAARLDPDVVLMDIRMPAMDGIEATRQICARLDSPRVLVLTTFDVDDHVHDALRAGASGYLLKDATAADMAAAIRAVAAGEATLAPSVTRRLIERAMLGGRPVEVPALAHLTDRETEVLRLVARGLSNAEIAAALVLGEATVKTHVARVLLKLGVRDRVQATILAYESGFVVPGQG